MPGSLGDVLSTGLIGGFTTLSTATVQTAQRLRRRWSMRALAAPIGILAIGVLFASAARTLIGLVF